jgi:hypothetical protein
VTVTAALGGVGDGPGGVVGGVGDGPGAGTGVGVGPVVGVVVGAVTGVVGDAAEAAGVGEVSRLTRARPVGRPVTGTLAAGVAVAVPPECRTAQATRPQ